MSVYKKTGLMLVAFGLVFCGARAYSGAGNELAYFAIPQLATLAGTELDPTADYMPVYDASALAVKKMLVQRGGTDPIVITGTGALTNAVHSGHVLYLSSTGATTLTLPAATGTGKTLSFVVGAVNTSGYVITKAGSDLVKGSIHYASSTTGYDYGSTANGTITLNGTTKGGAAAGDWLELRDVGTGVWNVKGAVTPSGVKTTPFS